MFSIKSSQRKQSAHNGHTLLSDSSEFQNANHNSKEESKPKKNKKKKEKKEKKKGTKRKFAEIDNNIDRRPKKKRRISKKSDSDFGFEDLDSDGCITTPVAIPSPIVARRTMTPHKKQCQRFKLSEVFVSHDAWLNQKSTVAEFKAFYEVHNLDFEELRIGYNKFAMENNWKGIFFFFY